MVNGICVGFSLDAVFSSIGTINAVVVGHGDLLDYSIEIVVATFPSSTSGSFGSFTTGTETSTTPNWIQ